MKTLPFNNLNVLDSEYFQFVYDFDSKETLLFYSKNSWITLNT